MTDDNEGNEQGSPRSDDVYDPELDGAWSHAHETDAHSGGAVSHVSFLLRVTINGCSLSLIYFIDYMLTIEKISVMIVLNWFYNIVDGRILFYKDCFQILLAAKEVGRFVHVQNPVQRTPQAKPKSKSSSSHSQSSSRPMPSAPSSSNEADGELHLPSSDVRCDAKGYVYHKDLFCPIGRVEGHITNNIAQGS